VEGFTSSIKKILTANSAKKAQHLGNKHMAKKSSIEKQKRRELLVQRQGEKRRQLRERSTNMNLSEEERQDARTALNKMPRDSSVCRLRNRCSLTGRCRGYLRKFGLSRLCFREMAHQGLLPGVTKSSW
jgi:small subunit ribosomal protein S14